MQQVHQAFSTACWKHQRYVKASEPCLQAVLCPRTSYINSIWHYVPHQLQQLVFAAQWQREEASTRQCKLRTAQSLHSVLAPLPYNFQLFLNISTYTLRLTAECMCLSLPQLAAC